MSIWAASPIEDTPQIELAGWRIYEVDSEYWPGSTRHFVGYNLTEHEGRVSSAIVEFDKEKMIGKTQSGRVYKLSKKRVTMGDQADGFYVWNAWMAHNKITFVKEIFEGDL